MPRLIQLAASASSSKRKDRNESRTGLLNLHLYLQEKEIEMNGKDYMMTQITMIELGKKIETLDLDGFLNAVSNAKAAAPVLDPTLYIRAAKNLDAIERLAKTFNAVKTEFSNTRDVIVATTVAAMQRTTPSEMENLS